MNEIKIKLDKIQEVSKEEMEQIEEEVQARMKYFYLNFRQWLRSSLRRN
jgi:hypothetical protein